MTHLARSCLAGILLAFVSSLVVPVAQAQTWSPVAGEFQGGYVRGLYVPSLGSSTATGDSWAAVYYSGMFKRAPGSSTWTPMNTGIEDKRVYGFALNAGVSPYRGYAAVRGGGVYKTTDGGANWTAVNNGLGCVYVISVQFVGVAATATTAATSGFGATASTDRLMATTGCASNSGVYLSTDGGANWTLTSGMSAGVQAVGVARVIPSGSGLDFLVAATYDGIYKSTDNGLNWTPSSGNMTNPNGPTPNVHNVTYLYNGSPAALTLYAAEQNTGVWKSTDQGTTWTLVLNKITTAAGIGTDGSGNGNLYYPVDGEGVYMSADQGVNWTLFASNAALPGARAIQRKTTVPSSPIFYSQNYAGIYQSADGGVTWNKDSTGLPAGYTVAGGYDTSGNSYVSAAEGVYKKPPGGSTFQRLGGYNLGFFMSGGHAIVTSAGVPYAITSSLGVFKYDGTNWVAKNAGLPTMTRQGNHIRSDPNNANGLYLGLASGGMYYSADGGETWTTKNAGLTGNALQIRQMSISSAFAVIGTNDGLYKSTNGGATWTRLPFAAKDPANAELPAAHLRIDSGSGNIYAAVYQTSAAGVTYPGSGIWKSTDGGMTWTQSLAGKQAYEISVARTANGVTLYAGLWDPVGGGAMQSTDEGATWTPINTGLTNNYIVGFAIQDGMLKGVSTMGEGVFAFTPPAVGQGITSGWNLLGNGLDNTIAVSSAFGDAAKVSTVWKWISASSTWAFYTPTLSDGGAAYAAGKGYDVLTTITAGEGFWVNAKQAFSVQLSGNPVPTNKFADGLATNGLPPGWSLIAIGDNKTPTAFTNAIAVSLPAGTAVATSLTTLWAWDSDLSGWYFFAPSLVNAGTQAAYIASKSYLDFGSKTLSSTTGFWVNKP